VIYEEDDLTRALLRQWLAEAGYRVHIGTQYGSPLLDAVRAMTGPQD
jgi:hypothetical protein